jgi:hypothetical protein
VATFRQSAAVDVAWVWGSPSWIFDYHSMIEEQANVIGVTKHGLNILARSCRQGEGPGKST